MAQTAEITAIVVATLNLIVAAGGGWAWWRGERPKRLWWAWRVAQVSTSALAIIAAVAVVTGYDPVDQLFWLYLLLPMVVSIIAEQLRIAAAQTVLDQRDLADAQAVGRLPVAEQNDVVHAIVSREIGIIALAAVVIALLALRVLMTV
jgi:hypothetical protein